MSGIDRNVYYQGKQFLRFTEVEIKDFKNSTKVSISDDFEIDFEYFKTLDQTQEDDSGKVTIYGLKDETIELLEQEGGEVWLRCGYLGSKQIDILFVAYISKVYTEKKNNTSATTIECSANLMTHFFAGYAISDGEDVTVPLSGLLKNLGMSLGFPATHFNTSNVPISSEADVKKFLNSYITKNYRIGDLKTIVESVCDAFGLRFRRALIEGVDSAEFSFTDLGLKKTLKKISSGYPAIDMNNDTTQNLSNIVSSTWSADEELRQGVLLTKESGLIEAQAEYQIITAFADQKLNANEEETEESIYKRNNPTEKKAKKGNSSEVEELLSRTSGSDINTVPTNSGDGFVNNSVLQGLVIKGGVGGQATQGGRVKGYTADFAAIVSQVLGNDLIRFTGFNDKFHMRKGGRHPVGQAFDVTIKSAHKGAPNQKQRILSAAKQQGFKIKVLDEYNHPSSEATAGHLHVSVYGRNSGSSEVNSDISELDNSDNSTQQGDPYGRVPIEINRKYNKITALLNPLVKPQSLVFTKDRKSDDYLIHRVRHATYKGNNKRGDWTMVLYCEDTETKKVAPETLN